MAILKDRQDSRLREKSKISELTNTKMAPKCMRQELMRKNPNAATGNVIATSDSSQQITETLVSVV